MNPNPKIKYYATLYFVFQGIGVAMWWMMLLYRPATRSLFELEPHSDTSLMAFWMADLVFILLGSFAVAALIYFDSEFTVAALWLVTGAVSYASLYTFAYALSTGAGWLGVVMMFPTMIWSGNFAIGLTPAFRKAMFRTSAKAGTSWLFLKTLAQIAVVWTLILYVFPQMIVRVETKLGIPQFAFLFQVPIFALVFVLLSSIGVYAAYSMSKTGEGTPLPMDGASKLVINGIYAYIRNPMAVSGIGQALAVGMMLGSRFVLLYALMGGLIWQLIYRPLEEDNLARRFGADYEDYRQKVKCWIPGMKPYRAGDTA